MKANAIIRIVLFSLAILVLFSILLGFLAFGIFRSGVKTRIEQIEPIAGQTDIHTIIPDIQNIEIEWVAGSITFQKDDVSSITVQEFSPVESKYKMVVKQSGQTFKIQYSDSDSIIFPFGINIDISKDLVIKVPENWECNSLEVDTASAEMTLNDLSVRKFDFDGASGVCEINNCSIGELDIDTASGNVHFSGTLKTLDCDAVSADCNVEVFNIPDKIKMKGISGDLELILPSDAGFTCDLDTMSGSFNTDFEFVMNDNFYICGDGNCKINVNAVSGDVNILKGIEKASAAMSHHCADPSCTDPSHNYSYACTIADCNDSEHSHYQHH